jgi:hypothetical protein
MYMGSNKYIGDPRLKNLSINYELENLGSYPGGDRKFTVRHHIQTGLRSTQPHAK